MENKIHEIERIFYQQFSENQHKENDFLLRLLTLIGAVLFGYGYILIGLKKGEYEIKDAYGILFFTLGILLTCLKLIFDLGYGFRRDQLVFYKIAKKYNLIASTKEEKGKVFPYYFNPFKKFKKSNNKLQAKNPFLFFWMPALHNTLAFTICLFILILIATFYMKTLRPLWETASLCIGSLFIAYIIFKRKHKWLERLYSEGCDTN